jgi:integrase
MVQKIVKRWADYSRLGDLSPHDLRRTAITRALESGLTYRQVQMMSKHKDPKTVMR